MKGGEQGDPMMPFLFSFGQHRALVSIQAQLKEGERLFAFLDDIYVVSSTEWPSVWGHIKVVEESGSRLREMGVSTPPWEALAEGLRPQTRDSVSRVR